MIIPRHYENLHVLHENTAANRSYYIPAEERFDDLVENREHSGRFQLLNGMWRFRYFDSIYDLKDEFYREGYGKRASERYRCRAAGRITVLTAISTRTRDIRSPWTRLTFLRKIPAALISIILSMSRMRPRQRHF